MAATSFIVSTQKGRRVINKSTCQSRAGFMGIPPMQLHRSLYSERPHAWSCFKERVINCIKMWNILIYFLVSERFPWSMFIILNECKMWWNTYLLLGSGTLVTNTTCIRQGFQQPHICPCVHLSFTFKPNFWHFPLDKIPSNCSILANCNLWGKVSNLSLVPSFIASESFTPKLQVWINTKEQPILLGCS